MFWLFECSALRHAVTASASVVLVRRFQRFSVVVCLCDERTLAGNCIDDDVDYDGRHFDVANYYCCHCSSRQRAHTHCAAIVVAAATVSSCTYSATLELL